MLNKERKIMENKLFREKIVKEYVKCKKPEKKLTDVVLVCCYSSSSTILNTRKYFWYFFIK